MKIKIVPGAIPDDMTQEELDEIIEVMTRKFEEGTLIEDSEEIDMDELREEDPELYDYLMSLEDEGPEDLH